MSYTAPYVDPAGLHIPTFDDILQSLITSAKTIYGSTIYLDADSEDYQFISAIALMIYDSNLAVQESYNNRTPVGSIGVGLDDVVKMNGLVRQAASHSTATVTLVGTSGTVITSGIVSDINGEKWDLPSSVTIPVSGTIDVTVTAETVGAVSALAGEISVIDTPTSGWTSVTNADAATLGTAEEPDSDLRSRQEISVTTPSQTLLDKTIAAIVALTDVTRYLVLENDTGSPDTDPNGLDLPSHSITCVVEGDTDINVANAIYLNRGIGCYTNGDIVEWITNTVNGAKTKIQFYRPTYVPIYVDIYVKDFDGYTSATTADIKLAVKNYLNSLQIYKAVTLSGVEGAALSIMPNLAKPLFSIEELKIGLSSITLGTDDIPIDYLHVASGSSTHINVYKV